MSDVKFFKPEDLQRRCVQVDESGRISYDDCIVIADGLNAILDERGVRVYKYKGSKHADWSPEIDEAFGGVKKYDAQGLVVDIQPIKKETAEDLLREIVTDGRIDSFRAYDEWLERARALLDSQPAKREE